MFANACALFKLVQESDNRDARIYRRSGKFDVIESILNVSKFKMRVSVSKNAAQRKSDPSNRS